jgi:hypothetical protein
METLEDGGPNDFIKTFGNIQLGACKVGASTKIGAKNHVK